MIPRKRPLELLESFRLVLHQLPKARLTIVGDGPLMTEVKEAAARMGDRVAVPGRREGADLSEIYARSDILVLPAVREVWGLVINEALAHGLYVIATDQVGSAHDLVRAQAGTIVPPDDREELAKAMVEAPRNAAPLMRRRGPRAREPCECHTRGVCARHRLCGGTSDRSRRRSHSVSFLPDRTRHGFSTRSARGKTLCSMPWVTPSSLPSAGGSATHAPTRRRKVVIIRSRQRSAGQRAEMLAAEIEMLERLGRSAEYTDLGEWEVRLDRIPGSS